MWPTRQNDLIRGARLNGKRQTSQPDVFPQPWPSDKNHTEICKTSKYAAPQASNIFRHNSQKGGRKTTTGKKRKKKPTLLLKTVSLLFNISRLRSDERSGCLRHFFLHVWMCMSWHVCDTHMCARWSFLCVCVPNSKCVCSLHEIYYIHTVSIFKKKKKDFKR